MNIKVVIVWIFAIILFAGLGVFGLVNQDLLVDESEDTYVPKEDVASSARTCSKDLASGRSSYSFLVNADTNLIDRVTITYTATSLDIDNYTAAANINNLDIAGMTTQLNGTSSDFSLIVQINTATFNEADIAAYETDFSRLSIVAKNVRDYTQYQSEIATGTGVTDYVCD